MAIAAVGAGNSAPIPQPAAKVDSPHDGDSDDAAAKAAVQAAPAPGTGAVVNKSA
jgi:hypothetical protein